MAWSGWNVLASSAAWGSSPDITAKFEYAYQRSGSDMQYKVRITVNTLPYSSSYFGYPIYATIKLDGTTKVSGHQLKAGSPAQWPSAIVYTTDVLTVAGKTSGTTQLLINLYSGSGESRDKTYSYNLNVSPAASIPTAEASSVELGSSVKIYTNSRDASYYHRIGCEFGSYSHWGKDIFDDDIARSWFLFSPPVSLASQIPNATSGTCTIYLATYSDAACTKKVGDTQSMTLTLKVPASVKPTVSAVALSDEAGYLATFGAYVQGKSRLKLQATASAEYSTIKSYTFIVDGQKTVQATNEMTVELLNAGTISVTVRATDMRGYESLDYTTSITVLPYTRPSMSGASVRRCDSSGQEDGDGTYIAVNATAIYSTLGGQNTVSMRARSRSEGGTWSGYRIVDGTVWGTFDNTKSYEVEISIADKVETGLPLVFIVPTAEVAFHLRDGGKGAAFGKYAEKDALECAWPAEFKEDVEVAGKLNVAGHINGNYLQGTWLQSTEHTDLNKAPTSYPVFDGSGWVYHRTKEEMLSDLGIFPFKVAVCKKASTTQTAVNDYWSIKCPAETGYTRIVAGIRTGEPASIIVKNYDFNGDYIRVYTQNTSGASKTFAISVEVLFIPDVNITAITT